MPAGSALEGAGEELPRLAGAEGGAGGLDVGHHDAFVGPPEELVAVARPAGSDPPASETCHLPLPVGKRADVDRRSGPTRSRRRRASGRRERSRGMRLAEGVATEGIGVSRVSRSR